MKRHIVMTLLSGALAGALILASGAGAAAFPRVPGNFRVGPVGIAPMGRVHQHTVSRSALTINQAQHQVQSYLQQYRNPHLVIAEIIEFQRIFYALVKDTSTHHGAVELLVNKWTGVVFPEYGPGTMWNTQFGMMRGGMMGIHPGNRSMAISPAQAARIAQQWLARHRTGATTESPVQFPGYYTVHFHENGVMAGMLSVNGYSSQTWYHTWHGTFIRLKTVNG